MSINNSLAHAPAGPVAFEDLTVEDADSHSGVWQPNWPAGTERRVLGRDPITGGSTTLLVFPAGYDRPDEIELARADGSQRFEYHTSHEEIFSIEGDYLFGDPEIYDFSAPAYLNHPPYWLHPARQRSSTGVMLLVKNNQPVDFLFCKIPEDWDGVETYAEVGGSVASPSEAVTLATLDGLNLVPIREYGDPLEGVSGARLWEDRVDGWQTWVLVGEENASFSMGEPEAHSKVPVGDEWFVLDGQVRFSSASGDEQVLSRYGYWCDAERYPVGGYRPTAAVESRVIRWVRGGALDYVDEGGGPENGPGDQPE